MLGLSWSDYLVSIGNATLGQVVWAHLQSDLVTGENANLEHAHFSGKMGKNFMAVLESDSEHGVRQELFDFTSDLQKTFLTHLVPTFNHGFYTFESK